MSADLPDEDRQALQQAKTLLENPGVAARIADVFGATLDKGFKLLPAGWSARVGAITQAALLKSAEAAIFTMKDVPGEPAANAWHKLGVAVSGGVGGFFGLAGAAAELPVSTTIMLRSIADVARSQGESIAAMDTKLACLEVFALGGGGPADDGAETGYYAIRYALARSVSEAAEFAATQALSAEGAPVLGKLIAKIAERFGVQVTEKFAAQAVPAIGALGGAAVNAIFIAHFQDMARGHFTVRRLERRHGADAVRRWYAALPKRA